MEPRATRSGGTAPYKVVAVSVTVALLAMGLTMVLFFALLGSKGGPEETVGRFYQALGNRDGKALGDTLSEDARMCPLVDLVVGTEGTRYDCIRVFLKDDLTAEELESMELFISQMKEVEQYQYVSKDEAMEEFKQMYKDNPRIIEEIKGNPLPASFMVWVGNPQDIDEVADLLRERPEVSEDPETARKEVQEPEILMAGFMEDGVRFEDLQYSTRVEGDRATIEVVAGRVVLAGATKDILEPEVRMVVPTYFELENQDGAWLITFAGEQPAFAGIVP